MNPQESPADFIFVLTHKRRINNLRRPLKSIDRIKFYGILSALFEQVDNLNKEHSDAC